MHFVNVSMYVHDKAQPSLLNNTHVHCLIVKLVAGLVALHRQLHETTASLRATTANVRIQQHLKQTPQRQR